MSVNVFHHHLFPKKSYSGNITIFVYISWGPLRICYSARCVHFTLLLGRRGTLFFMKGQWCTSVYSSKRFKPFSAIILLCEGYCLVGKNKQGIQLCYDTFIQTKKHFVIPFRCCCCCCCCCCFLLLFCLFQ